MSAESKATYRPTGVEKEKELEFGGTLSGAPLPNEPFYPLRQDQFLTFRDGETSEARATRDACISAFVAAAVGLTGLIALIRWDAPISDQKVAFAATSVLGVGAIATLVITIVEQRHITRTRTRSPYSRLVATIEKHFQVPPSSGVKWGSFLKWFREKGQETTG